MRILRLPYALVRIPTELALEVAKRAGGAAVSVVYGLVRDDDERVAVRVPDEPDYFRRPEPPAEPPASGSGGAPPTSAEPAHVSEEPELVAEVADEAAAEGAGPEVRVQAPWPGYGRMTAAEIIARLRAETPEVAAAVSLYEASRSGRRPVLEAAARGMR